jgi:drug/metabolite transporter (DMT)-like permease
MARTPPPADSPRPASFIHRLRVRTRAIRRQASGFSPSTRGILWALGAGLSFSVANAALRVLTLEIHPMQGQLLRYAFGMLPLLPLLWRVGLRDLQPESMKDQLWRAMLHTVGLSLWFLALPHLPLADMTAISFTNPLFVLVGAAWVLKEPMSTARWVSVAVGFMGVLVVVGQGLTGSGGWYSLLMLASAPVFAASFLLTKVLTRRDSVSVIVFWQTLLVTLLSLPLALAVWTGLSAWQWLMALIGGILGTAGHYCLTRSFASADISATQSVKFVDLLWAAGIGWIVFSDPIRPSTLLGGAIIVASIVGLARYERLRPAKPAA